MTAGRSRLHWTAIVFFWALTQRLVGSGNHCLCLLRMPAMPNVRGVKFFFTGCNCFTPAETLQVTSLMKWYRSRLYTDKC
jgi:hypothetical protein